MNRAGRPAGPGPAACLLAARTLRDFGDGFVSVLLPVFLLNLGLTPLEVGVVATAALFGSACLTIAAGLMGAGYGYRRLLLGAAGLMIATGVAYATVHNYALLLVVALVGTVNPSAGSASLFVPLEHAALATAGRDVDRTRLFARYSLVGALAAAAGALAAITPEFATHWGVNRGAAIRAMFVLYALLGLGGGLLYARLPTSERIPHAPRAGALGPSRSVVMKLAALFSLDAFGGGFVVQSLLALWLFQRFDLSLQAAGTFFFWSGVASAFSFPVAAWLSGRIGLVNTMVFTHIPSSVLLILAAFAPNLPVTLGLLLLRAALSQMDVPTRSSYVMAIVTEQERAAAASFTAVPRSLAGAASPALAGALFAASYYALPLVLCGSLKIIYDLLLLMQFRHHRPPEERTELS